jgi:hypothetical protein
MVLPRFIRYPNSPVLTPIINKMVKMMMSHRTFLGMHLPPLDSAQLGKAVDRNPDLLLLNIISRRAVPGKKFFRMETIS